MKTFSIDISLTGKVTIPDSTLRDLRIEAAQAPGEEGGDRYLHELHNRFPEDDDQFLQHALKNALRNIVRNGVVTDIGGMGVGVRAAPAVVNVSVPERVVTQVKERKQLRYVGTEEGTLQGGAANLQNIQKDWADNTAYENAARDRNTP
ncbi:hypothetical protein HOR51_gp16 [Ralstonia phage phiAp1]|uniref:Uncharacterized protein n=1 Tax=Ralstonia phage phiAp1 TaxID=2783867 RepID=A0A1L7DS34_9CAUD|nr:hypothetical protein HOR51_gp16 [Ralstonia phage phiAp1]APU03157.1 hypothetical protein phiAp1_16 [Ralstonia phage phiAp1]